MGKTLYYLIIGLFISLIFFNFYFRFKILKHFKVLKKNRVQFGWKHIKSKRLLEEEIIPRYPEQKDDIRQFVHQIHFSFKIVILILVSLVILGLVSSMA